MILFDDYRSILAYQYIKTCIDCLKFYVQGLDELDRSLVDEDHLSDVVTTLEKTVYSPADFVVYWRLLDFEQKVDFLDSMSEYYELCKKAEPEHLRNEVAINSLG